MPGRFTLGIVENYLIWYRKATEKTKRAAENYLIPLNVFLSTIERNQYPEAPKTPTALLLFREDKAGKKGREYTIYLSWIEF